MDDFFARYAKLIRFGLYTVIILMMLLIVFLFVQTSPIWGGVASQILKLFCSNLIGSVEALSLNPSLQ